MAQESSRSGLDIQTRIKSTATNALQTSNSTAIPTHTSSITVTEPASTYSSSKTTRKRSWADELPKAATYSTSSSTSQSSTRKSHFDEDPVRVANVKSRLQKAIDNYRHQPRRLVLTTLDPKKGKRNHKNIRITVMKLLQRKGRNG